MARGNAAAQTAANSAISISGQSNTNAESLYGTLAPQLEAEAAHPAGFAPTDLAAMNTAAQQSAGGSEGAAVGQGALRAARTRNAGAADAAIAQSGRQAGQELSKGALGTQIANSNLKNTQQQHALTELGNLYGQNLGESVGALGEVAPNINANTNAEQATWDWTKIPGLSAAGTDIAGNIFKG